MNRRDFLKIGGAVSVALLVQASPVGNWLGETSSAEAKGMQYRGTPDGKIYKSPDGKNWELMVDFGSAYSIQRVGTDLRGKVTARLRYAGRGFEVYLLDDGKSWWLG